MDFKLIDDFFNNKTNNLSITSNNENETLEFSKYLAKYLKVSDVLVLNGELGSGKTLFTKGICSYYNLENSVSSPTFTIVNEYVNNKINIYHFDVYKIKSIEEFENTIGTDYFSSGICIIEWGDIIQDILPRKTTITVNITKENENTRIFNLKKEEL